MMLGELNRSNPTVQVPPWDPFEDHTAGLPSPYSVSSPSFNNVGSGGDYSPYLDAFASLHRYLPSNEFFSGESDSLSEESDSMAHAVDAFSCDHFRMFEFKVRRCARGRSHDWTECPFAHPGEKARRRDPRKHHYSGTACAEFRKGNCKKGDSCEFAHGVFECWLHPARYRTQPCKDGLSCRRRVCFFAHTPEQLRVLSPTDSPIRMTSGSFGSSPTSILTSPPISPPSDSPPNSPQSSELVAAMRNLRIGKTKMSSPSWGFSSPRGGSMLRPGFCSVPTTPTQSQVANLWDQSCDEEPAMERVESGRNLRARMYAKLSKENSLGRVDSPGSAAPDVGWISELVK